MRLRNAFNRCDQLFTGQRWIVVVIPGNEMVDGFIDAIAVIN